MGAGIALALVIRTYFPAQKSQPFPIQLVPAMRRTVRLTVRFLAIGLQGATLTTTTAAAARAFRDLCSLICPWPMRMVRPISSAAIMAMRRCCSWCRRRIALARRAQVLAGQGHADQALDIAQIAHVLGACDE